MGRGRARAWRQGGRHRRNADSVADLAERYGDENALPLALDVTDKEAVRDAVAKAREHFGRLDVVVNNAGYGLFGSIEEVSEEQARDQIETNSSARCGSPRPCCPSCASRARAM